MKVGAVVQVRMSSQRLPRKALIEIAGKPVLGWVVSNLQRCKKLNNIVVATTIDSSDDEIEAWCNSNKIACIRGSSENVLARMLAAGQAHNLDTLVRVTGDSPLVSSEIVDYLVEGHQKNLADYTNIDRDQLPVGVSADVSSYAALLRLNKFDLDFNHTEYLAFYFKNNPNVFKVCILSALPEFKSKTSRLTLDFPEDLELITQILTKLQHAGRASTLSNVIQVITDYPELNSINQMHAQKHLTDSALAEKIRLASTISAQ